MPTLIVFHNYKYLMIQLNRYVGGKDVHKDVHRRRDLCFSLSHLVKCSTNWVLA